MNITTHVTEQLADTLTPVTIFLRLRHRFNTCLLLESSDYHTKENSFSLLCAEPIAEFKTLTNDSAKVNELHHFIQNINMDSNHPIAQRFNSVFGYSSFDAVQSFENIKFNPSKPGAKIPSMLYHLYRYLIVIDHFSDRLYILENIPDGESPTTDSIKETIFRGDIPKQESFAKLGERSSNMTDDDFKALVTKGKHHCQIGDVFQIVLSRRFQQSYKGDVFNVYRSLRSINPSPYSFFFDYGSYRIFGASPEAQIIVRNQMAEIHPIAGTFKRSGDDELDAQRAQELLADPKENAEHVMLVDLARNDLSRNAKKVEVVNYKQVQYFSHVIHLVSKVQGELAEKNRNIRVYADTFPAGTLSGAPKYKAMQIIDELEPTSRGIYGGAIGAFGLNGDVNHAITIRSFFSENETLYYQAGAGVVIDSDEEKENQEVFNKLAALGKALEQAETI